MNKELLDCPFCGGGASIQNGLAHLWYVECRECLIDGKIEHTEHEAIAAWNRRAQPERKLTDAEILALAKDRFGWAYTLDGFEDAIKDFTLALLAAQPAAATVPDLINEIGKCDGDEEK